MTLDREEAATACWDELVDEYGEEAMMEWVDGGATPATCPDGCQVEPDGVCPHGNPSVLLEAGLI